METLFVSNAYLSYLFNSLLRCFVFFLLTILSAQSLAQEYEEVDKKILENLIALDFKKNKSLLGKVEPGERRSCYETLTALLYNAGNNKKEDSINYKKLQSFVSSDHNPERSIVDAYYNLFYNRRNGNLANYIDSAYQDASDANNNLLKKLSILAGLRFYNRENVQNKEITRRYIKKYEDVAINNIDSTWISIHNYLLEGRSPESNRELLEAFGEINTLYLEKNKLNYSIGLRAQLLELIGLHNWIHNKQDRALTFLNSVSELPELPYLKEHKFNTYLDISRIKIQKGKIDEAKLAIAKAFDNLNESDRDKNLITFYKFKAHYFFKPQKKHDSAYFYLNKAFNLNREISYGTINAQIANLDKKLGVAAKDKEILLQRNNLLEEQALKKRNQNIAIALGGSLILLTIIGSLTYRNAKRRQRIAEQEKELEIQKTTTILKEQEINTINAMVEGQEKERIRLAGDLHDNLGGTLAAVKMHIGNLQQNLHKTDKPQELLDKANELIEQAYKNVRAIAHERNSGVMAKEGLLPAIEKLADKVAVSGGLSIEVQGFGLEQRLSNHLEITIFRIVQELVTNVIKHAQATEVQISLTQHEYELNIVVEDNGKGFIVGKLEEKEGMGLGSIERRVEHLEGTMLVDSSLGKGTNIIIDIPI